MFSPNLFTKLIYYIFTKLLSYTVINFCENTETSLKGHSEKGHNTFNLSIKDKYCGPNSTMAIQFYLLKRTTL